MKPSDVPIRLARESLHAGARPLLVSILAGLAVVSSAAATTDSASTDAILKSVNPELRPIAQKYLAMSSGDLPSDRVGIAKLRARPIPGLPALEKPALKQMKIPGPKDAPDVVLYAAGADVPGKNRPILLYMHGGGYIFGSAGAEVRRLQEISLAVDCVVVSVDYRLAPETPFPGANDDNLAALRWLHDHADEVGGNAQNMAIMGESAGGGLAAMLAIAARDRGSIPLKMQVLIYPMLDDRTGSTVHPPPAFGRLMWNEQANRVGWTSWLGMTPGTAQVPVRAAAAREVDLSGLPPTFIGVGSIDLFAPEDIQFASRLMAAGVPTELDVVPGAFHGFNVIAREADVSKQFEATWQKALRRAFGTGAM